MEQPQRLSADRLKPGARRGRCRVEPEASFFPSSPTSGGLTELLLGQCAVPEEALSVHLWAHLWWERRRARDFSPAHAGWAAPALLRGARTTLADLTRPYLPNPPSNPRRSARRRARDPRPTPWSYLSLDENSGYGVAGLSMHDRTGGVRRGARMDAVHPRIELGDGDEPAPGHFERDRRDDPQPEVIVAHLVPEFFPLVRRQAPDGFLVGYTAWETDRIPDHWVPCLERTDLIVVPSKFSAEAIAASG